MKNWFSRPWSPPSKDSPARALLANSSNVSLLGLKTITPELKTSGQPISGAPATGFSALNGTTLLSNNLSMFCSGRVSASKNTTRENCSRRQTLIFVYDLSKFGRSNKRNCGASADEVEMVLVGMSSSKTSPSRVRALGLTSGPTRITSFLLVPESRKAWPSTRAPGKYESLYKSVQYASDLIFNLCFNKTANCFSGIL